MGKMNTMTQLLPVPEREICGISWGREGYGDDKDVISNREEYDDDGYLDFMFDG